MADPVTERIMQPCRTMEAQLEAEFDKGMVEGMQLVLNLPAMIFSQQPEIEGDVDE